MKLFFSTVTTSAAVRKSRHSQSLETSTTINMWWSKKPDDDAKASQQPKEQEPSASAAAGRAPFTTSAEQRYDGPRKDASAPFDPNKLPDRAKLPPALQKIVDKQEKEENFFDELVDG